MVVSSGGVGKVAAAVDLSVLFKCVFIFKTVHIELLEMCLLGVSKQNIPTK